MNDIIVANPDGTEVRVMLFNEYDFEIGDEENSFLITSPRAEWERVEENSRIYIPGTEYGGLYKRLESDTKNNSVAVGQRAFPMCDGKDGQPLVVFFQVH